MQYYLKRLFNFRNIKAKLSLYPSITQFLSVEGVNINPHTLQNKTSYQLQAAAALLIKKETSMSIR